MSDNAAQEIGKLDNLPQNIPGVPSSPEEAVHELTAASAHTTHLLDQSDAAVRDLEHVVGVQPQSQPEQVQPGTDELAAHESHALLEGQSAQEGVPDEAARLQFSAKSEGHMSAAEQAIGELEQAPQVLADLKAEQARIAEQIPQFDITSAQVVELDGLPKVKSLFGIIQHKPRIVIAKGDGAHKGQLMVQVAKGEILPKGGKYGGTGGSEEDMMIRDQLTLQHGLSEDDLREHALQDRYILPHHLFKNPGDPKVDVPRDEKEGHKIMGLWVPYKDLPSSSPLVAALKQYQDKLSTTQPLQVTPAPSSQKAA